MHAPLELVSPGSWQLDVDPDNMPVIQLPEQETAPVASHPLEMESPPALSRIIEALLFVTPQELPAEKICSIIRGLTPVELDHAVQELNLSYRKSGKPYSIILQKQSYRLALRTKYQHHLEQLYGGIREVRLSPIAVETLAIIAYRQPLTASAIEVILGQDCTQAVRQLIRRGLVQMNGEDHEKLPLYCTTSRFLKFFHLTRVEDLPRADDMERL